MNINESSSFSFNMSLLAFLVSEGILSKEQATRFLDGYLRSVEASDPNNVAEDAYSIIDRAREPVWK